MGNGEIALIPRPYQKPSAKQKAEYAKKMNASEESNFVSDEKEVKKYATAFEKKVAEDLAKIGIKV